MVLLYWVSALLIIIAISGVPTVCGNTELRALMEIKLSLDPDNKYLSSWTSDGDPCGGTFLGVACNEHWKVANISLQGKGLAGKVSPAVAELKCLSGLYLHYNALTGEIPREIANLTELIDLYLDWNNLSGTIPLEIGDMASLQVLDLCCNQLTGFIPTNMGSLKKLSVLALQRNRLNGPIPASLGDLEMLKRLNLSVNQLSGFIPERLANIAQLEGLDVRNNTLSGVVPPSLKRLNGGFHCENNPGLCGVGFPSLRVCTSWDDTNIIQVEQFKPKANNTSSQSIPASDNFKPHCNQTHCPGSSKLEQVAIVAGVITVAVVFVFGGFLVFIRYRRKKQKIGNTFDTSDSQLSTDQGKEFFYRKPASPLVSLEYSNGWDPFADSHDGIGASYELPPGFKFSLEDVESATQYFSDGNLLGKSNFSAVYKGILKDGSVVAVKSINVTCCKSEEAEFMKGLSLLTSLRHENLVKLRGFCCSKDRGECFLIYDFASKGNLLQYLDVQDGSSYVLDWPSRVSIISGIAKGIRYLHSSEPTKPAIVHQNISVEKVLIDGNFDPLISDSGFLKLLADDVVFSALKVSAALGYMAPEYITTGRFTQKSDVYAFGVIILQILSGKSKLSHLMRLAAESCRLEDFIDPNLGGKFFDSEAAKLTEIALACTDERPDLRPILEAVIEELSKCGGTS
ncbi:Leucine-rich repeat receptor-like serine/threonine-protein kinase [Actinidia chinensis var. chinensis]|uniref:Leucine-rich repeat receptor-like serine/threonine-protein kinase n=1 Tax=Actinidia chinensis var. chinensis TaxID=1590841 RepID=A0A2R6Q8A9_ACTCC|nr:Leucine-rich repeat receptor-like serine/threonine-protein kinase [Actinidia chinensis var. chinensis]